MKKIFYFIMTAALMAGCTNIIDENQPQMPNDSSKLVFEGGFGPTTRTAFDQAEGGVYNLTWSRGDAIGIFTLGGTTANINRRANLISSAAGQAKGIFIPVDEVIEGEGEGSSSTTISLEYPSSGTDSFLIYYPYVSGTDIDVDDVLIHSTIAPIQEQSAQSDKQIGKNGFSWGKATVDAATKKVNFSLTHAMAYIRFVVNTTEFASYQLKSVQLFDQKGEAALTGDFTFDPGTGLVTPVSGKTVSSVKVNVTSEFVTVSNNAEVYMTVLPCNLSTSDLYAVVSFAKQDGTTASIPMALTKKGNLPAGSMTTIELNNISSANNAFAWYEPVEKRELVDGWAYGSQNTYFVERPTVAGNLAEVKIDVKARGDFSMVKEPVYYGLLANADIRTLLVMPNGTSAYESVPSTKINDDYTITVNMQDGAAIRSKGTWGTVAIYDKDYNVLWSYMIQAYYDFDKPIDVEYPGTGFKLLDRCLGSTYGTAMLPRTVLASTDANYLAWDQSSAYFQWGRHVPFLWSNSGKTHYNKVYVSQEADLAYAISHPTLILAGYKGDDWDSHGDWKVGDHRIDLWGASNKTSEWYDYNADGVKTIYDPCPEGYRVACSEILKLVLDRGVRDETKKEINKECLKYPLGSDKYDYWIYGGAHWGSNNSWGNRTSGVGGYLYWANCVNGAAPMRASILEGCYFSSGWGTAVDANRSHGFAVRCMKDELGK